MSTPYLKKHANGTYYVHWTENRVGKRVSTGEKEVSEAKRFLGTWLLMEHESSQGVLGAELTLADVWAVYDAKHVQAQVTGHYSAQLAWKQLVPHFGHIPASGLTQTAIDEYVAKRTSGRLGRKVKPQTVARELSWLRAAVKFCASDKRRVIDKSFARELSLPEPGEPRDRWLRHGEMQRLLDAAARLRKGDRLTRVERFLWLALETAGRAQALIDLTWDRVDFETRVIVLDVPGRRKTKKRRAVVPISTGLLPILERAYRERENDRVLDHGSPIWAAVQYVAIEAGFSVQPKPKTSQKPKATGISPHVLRHTAATHMARRGVPLFIVAKILGNTLAVVERVYAKHCPDDLREAVDLISTGNLEAAE